MRSPHPSIALALGTLLAAGSVRAGLLDDPPPTIPGAPPARVIYRMGAVICDPGRADTVIRCHNNADVPVAMAVEIYGEDDARASVTVHDPVPPGGEAIFATSPGVAGDDAVMIPQLAPLNQGKARVSAATSHLSCAGEQVIRSATPDGPMQSTPLPLVKKVATGEP
jgi:hypothetical protein